MSDKLAKILRMAVDNRPKYAQHKDKFIPAVVKAQVEALREEAKRNANFNTMKGQRNG